MKPTTVIGIVLMAACGTLAAKESSSPYIYAEWGKAETQPDVYLEKLRSDVYGLGIGYNFSEKLSAEILYTGGFSLDESTKNKLNSSITSASISVDKLDALYLGANYKVGEKYYAKISGGYSYTNLKLKIQAQSRPCCVYQEKYTENDSNSAFFAGLGLGIKLTDQFSIETNYRSTTGDYRFSTLTLGISYSFE